jgi:hypothetical protein
MGIPGLSQLTYSPQDSLGLAVIIPEGGLHRLFFQGRYLLFDTFQVKETSLFL